MITGVPGEASSLAGHLWMDLIRVGIDEEEVGKQLETEGVDKVRRQLSEGPRHHRGQTSRGRRMTRPDGNCDKAG